MVLVEGTAVTVAQDGRCAVIARHDDEATVILGVKHIVSRIGLPPLTRRLHGSMRREAHATLPHETSGNAAGRLTTDWQGQQPLSEEKKQDNGHQGLP